MRSPFALALLKLGVDVDEAERIVEALSDARVAEICEAVGFELTPSELAWMTGDTRVAPGDPGWEAACSVAIRSWCLDARALIGASREALLADDIDRRPAFGRTLLVAHGRHAFLLEILVAAGVFDPVPEGAP